MNRLQKLKHDACSFEKLVTLDMNATKLADTQTLCLIELSRASKIARKTI